MTRILEGIIKMSDVFAKLKVLYKNVRTLSDVGPECYTAENFGENSEVGKRLIMADEHEDVILSVSFGYYVMRHEDKNWCCALLHNADYNGRIQNIIVFVTKYEFKYANLNKNYVITDIDVRSPNLCVLVYYNVDDRTYLKYKCPVFIYGNLCENIEVHMEKIPGHNPVTQRGKWCVLYRIERTYNLVLFKDRRNIKKLVDCDQVLNAFSLALYSDLVRTLDFVPFIIVIKTDANIFEYAVLKDITGKVETEFKCWKVASLLMRRLHTGVVMAYLLDDDLGKTGTFVNIMLIKDIDKRKKNEFRLCDVDEYSECKEDVEFCVSNDSFCMSRRCIK
jgi:hypothetical protein